MISEENLKKKLLGNLYENAAPSRKIPTGPAIDKTPGTYKINLRQYVENPTGKGSAYVGTRKSIKAGLNLSFIALLQNYRNQFYAVPYIYDNGDMLYYVRVPSEDFKSNKITYDVLFYLEYDKALRRALRNIKVYSNCPSFVFTYCYVYNQKGIFIDKLKSKMPNEALTIAPDVRNPIESLGFEKSTYIAARYLIDGFCLTDDYVNRYGKKMTAIAEVDLFNKIADPETIVAVYQYAKYQEAKTHKKQLSANEKSKKDKLSNDFARDRRKTKPKTGFIVHKSPRSKITARKARKNLLNGK